MTHGWLSILAIGLVLAGVPPDPVIPGTFEPDFAAEGAPPHEGPVWTIATPAYAARLVLLDDATRQEFIRLHATSSADPFAVTPGKPRIYATFLLDLENRGEERLIFQPLLCRVVLWNGETRNPLDMATIESLYEMTDRRIPAAYASFGRLLLDEEVTLDPGGRRTGILAFQLPDPHAKKLTVEVRMTGQTGDALGFQVPYRFVKAPKAR